MLLDFWSTKCAICLNIVLFRNIWLQSCLSSCIPMNVCQCDDLSQEWNCQSIKSKGCLRHRSLQVRFINIPIMVCSLNNSESSGLGMKIVGLNVSNQKEQDHVTSWYCKWPSECAPTAPRNLSQPQLHRCLHTVTSFMIFEHEEIRCQAQRMYIVYHQLDIAAGKKFRPPILLEDSCCHTLISSISKHWLSNIRQIINYINPMHGNLTWNLGIE